MNLQFGILLQKKIYIVCTAEKYQKRFIAYSLHITGSFILSTFMILAQL